MRGNMWWNGRWPSRRSRPCLTAFRGAHPDTWHGLTIAEAVAVAGCSARAFTVRLYRARRRLSEALQSADQMSEPLCYPHACWHKTGRSIPPIDHISKAEVDMNQTQGIRLATDLEPGMLDRLAEDGSARHRDGDLACGIAEGPARGKQPPRSPAGRRRRALPAGGVAVTAAAAAAFAVAAQVPVTRPHPPSAAGPSPVTTSARGFRGTRLRNPRLGRRARRRPTPRSARLAYTEQIWMARIAHARSQIR